ncbi:acetoacetate decarboxylase family protein [Archaeoglobus sp.]
MAWTGPFTKSGKSALVAEGPWSYAMDAIAAHIICERDLLESAVPEGVKPTEDVYMYFADIVSSSPTFPELNYEAPGLVQYRELAFFVKVEFRGENYAYCPFMYVDNDVSLVRGYVAGFPKKMAVIDITRRHPMLKVEKVGGVAMRAGYRIAKLIVKPERDAESNPLDNFGKWLLYRISKPMGVAEFVEIVPEVQYGRIEKGEAKIEIGGGINDELEVFSVKEVVSGVHFSALLRIGSIRKL